MIDKIESKVSEYADGGDDLRLNMFLQYSDLREQFMEVEKVSVDPSKTSTLDPIPNRSFSMGRALFKRARNRLAENRTSN